MYIDNVIAMGKSSDGQSVSIIPKMANRHGLIAGATGTGKTTTLKAMAESFSDAGVPVFLSDVKGDLAGMCMDGEGRSYPTRFWDIYGKKGMPLRTTITEFGPLLISRILDLNQTQSDILNIVFKIADDKGLLLIDIKDLKSMLNYCSDNAKEFKADYGNISPQSVAAIMRALVSLEDKGAEKFFGEPALDINDFFKTSEDGRGYINVLAADSLIHDPTVYATFLLWLMGELFEDLPEVGDQEKPKMVFFFDEAHLLFNDAPKALLQKIEQVVKLIRSKGVGIYFVTQNPRDIPDAVLAQLGNKIQHALHAYTPAELKGLKAAAESFRENPGFNTEDAIQNLGIGEAVVSFIQADGSPSQAEIVKISLPQSKLGPIDDNMRAQIIAMDVIREKYSDMVDRDSAYEFLMRKMQMDAEEIRKAEEEALQKAEEEKAQKESEKAAEKEEKEAAKAAEKEEKEAAKAAEREAKEAAKAAEKEAKEAAKAEEKAQKEAEKEAEKQAKTTKRAVKNVGKTAASSVGRELGKSIGGSFGSFGKTLGGNIGASLGRGILDTLFKI